ncbi:MAG: LOG family protein [Acidimicrobiia bacterium]|nr:LOG family protein [Acidimicrobiia bacterium]MBT8218090.1 LOG family protein [Acidimicrobiia bacterium]NNF11194.1 LOG family protein [Acidimicrobiia bacterium]NNL71009.1 LOG family protein [Acidimicrobiia bacterium]
MRPYAIGDPEIDQLIEELVATAGGGDNADLIEEMIVTTLKLLRDDADRGDVKLANTALKEMRYPFRIFSRFKDVRKVSIFGSARTKPEAPDYKMAADFARLMTEDRNWMVITGAGPGIMEAGNEGAGRERSFGVNIRLPFEADANEHVLPDRLINFKYFFTRKLIFVKESHAFALFPGGFGTMDEAFEALTLIQTGKSELAPIVLLESDGTGYWETWEKFVRDDLLGNGMITPEDLNLFTHAHDVVEAADAICDFYANYHSQRYVDGQLVLRMQRGPGEDTLALLNEEFADIVVTGTIMAVPPSPAEILDGDGVDLARISFKFNRRHFGRLRQLINKLNTL